MNTVNSKAVAARTARLLMKLKEGMGPGVEIRVPLFAKRDSFLSG
jgi:hypothetical protein